MTRTLLLALLCFVTVPAADQVERDAWMVGSLNGQPLANLRATRVRHADGSATVRNEMLMALGRALAPGAPNADAIRMSQTTAFRESADGSLVSAEFSSDEMGSRAAASVTIAEGRVRGEVQRAGRASPVDLAIPPGVTLLSEDAQQRLLAATQAQPGSRVRLHALGLMQGQIRIISSTATCLAGTPTGSQWSMAIDGMEQMPVTIDLDPQAVVTAMRLDLGIARIDFVPADGPAVLGGATLAVTGVITAKGPPPGPGSNRYRLVEAARLPEDGFQRRETPEILVVGNLSQGAEPTELESLLAATPQLETDDPELRAWVTASLAGIEKASIADRAERLRRAVRDHLQGDLTRIDASALEAFRSRRGDCTEFANLLTAALRIAGIPARVDHGLVYAVEVGGWGGHAWVSAWDSEATAWIHLDAAYPGVPRSCYLRTGSPMDNPDGSLDAGISILLGKTIEVLPATP